MSELIPPAETSEPIPIRTGTITADDQKEAVVRLGSSKGGWWRQVGWRHLVAWVALFFGLFPILFVVSAAINPLGTLSTAQLIPTGASLENFSKLFDTTEYVHWYWQHHAHRPGRGGAVDVHLGLRRLRLLAASASGAGGSGCWACC